MLTSSDPAILNSVKTLGFSSISLDVFSQIVLEDFSVVIAELLGFCSYMRNIFKLSIHGDEITNKVQFEVRLQLSDVPSKCNKKIYNYN